MFPAEHAQQWPLDHNEPSVVCSPRLRIALTTDPGYAGEDEQALEEVREGVPDHLAI
jgi:hypothetical protein